jgi:hypothetical protein
MAFAGTCEARRSSASLDFVTEGISLTAIFSIWAAFGVGFLIGAFWCGLAHANDKVLQD